MSFYFKISKKKDAAKTVEHNNRSLFWVNKKNNLTLEILRAKFRNNELKVLIKNNNDPIWADADKDNDEFYLDHDYNAENWYKSTRDIIEYKLN